MYCVHVFSLPYGVFAARFTASDVADMAKTILTVRNVAVREQTSGVVEHTHGHLASTVISVLVSSETPVQMFTSGPLHATSSLTEARDAEVGKEGSAVRFPVHAVESSRNEGESLRLGQAVVMW